MSADYQNELIRRAGAAVAQSQTDAIVYAAEPGRVLRVLAAFAVSPTATALTFNSKGSSTGTAVSQTFTAAAGVPSVDLAYCPHGWFETRLGEGLSVNTGAGGTTAIMVVVVSLPGVAGLWSENGLGLLQQNGLPLLLESA